MSLPGFCGLWDFLGSLTSFCYVIGYSWSSVVLGRLDVLGEST